MLDCLILSPPLSIHYPHAAPRHPPVLAAYLAAVLREAGHSVQVLDLFHLGAGFFRVLATRVRAEPRVVAVVVGDYDRPLPDTSIPLCADRARLLFPRATLALAGRITAEQARRDLVNVPSLDLATHGDAEPVLAELVQRASLGRPLGEARGVVRREAGGLVDSGPAPPTSDLDALPFPAWDLLDGKLYGSAAHRHRKGGLHRILAGRGCPYHCLFCLKDTFCSTRQVRLRSPEGVVGEMRHLQARHGAKEIQFLEPVSVLDHDWMGRLCRLIRREVPGVIWSTHVRVDLLTPELLREMAGAGCWNILFGAESPDPEVQAVIRKKLTAEQMLDAVRWARAAGIESTASFMFGLPGETEARALQAIDFAVGLEPDYAQFFTTKIYADGLVPPELGQRIPEWEYRPYEIYGPPYLPAAYTSLEQLHRLRRLAYRRFYLRPGYVLRRGRGKGGISAQELSRLVRGGAALLKLALG